MNKKRETFAFYIRIYVHDGFNRQKSALSINRGSSNKISNLFLFFLNI